MFLVFQEISNYVSACNCDENGSKDLECDQKFGNCNCKPRVKVEDAEDKNYIPKCTECQKQYDNETFPDCNKCAPEHYGYDECKGNENYIII